MTSVLKRDYGNRARYLGSQNYERLHIYSTTTALMADVSTATGRVAYVVANDTVYVGQGGTWLPYPSGLGNGLVPLGAWNANTNTPTVTSGSGSTGQFYKVSVAGTTTIDGNSAWNVGDLLLFDGTTWDRILGPNGSAGANLTLLNSPCNFDAQNNPANGSGSNTTGRQFYPGQLLRAVGVKFFWNGPAGTIDCSLWNTAGTKVASIAVTVTSTPGIFNGTFGTPYTFLSADLGTIFTISMSESSGTHYQNAANPSLVPANAFSPPGILFAISVYASGVDVWPTTTGVTGQYIIEPVFG